MTDNHPPLKPECPVRNTRFPLQNSNDGFSIIRPLFEVTLIVYSMDHNNPSSRFFKTSIGVQECRATKSFSRKSGTYKKLLSNKGGQNPTPLLERCEELSLSLDLLRKTWDSTSHLNHRGPRGRMGNLGKGSHRRTRQSAHRELPGVKPRSNTETNSGTPGPGEENNLGGCLRQSRLALHSNTF